MRHGDTRPAEHLGQRRRVDGEGVDERHLVGPGDLNERQVGDIGPLGVELGVEAVALRGGDLGDQRLEGAGVDHQPHRLVRAPSSAHAGPGTGAGSVVTAAGGEGRRCKGSGEASAADHRTHFATGSTVSCTGAGVN